jgi:hypothetical protein
MSLRYYIIRIYQTLSQGDKAKVLVGTIENEHNRKRGFNGTAELVQILEQDSHEPEELLPPSK